METRPATAGLLDASACGRGFVPWVSSVTEQEAGASWPRELSDFGGKCKRKHRTSHLHQSAASQTSLGRSGAGGAHPIRSARCRTT